MFKGSLTAYCRRVCLLICTPFHSFLLSVLGGRRFLGSTGPRAHRSRPPLAGKLSKQGAAATHRVPWRLHCRIGRVPSIPKLPCYSYTGFAESSSASGSEPPCLHCAALIAARSKSHRSSGRAQVDLVKTQRQVQFTPRSSASQGPTPAGAHGGETVCWS